MLANCLLPLLELIKAQDLSSRFLVDYFPCFRDGGLRVVTCFNCELPSSSPLRVPHNFWLDAERQLHFVVIVKRYHNPPICRNAEEHGHC